MKRLMSVLMMVMLIVGAQAALVDGGFEAMTPGVIPDGGDIGVWKSFNGNFSVGSVQVRSGQQSVLIGANPLADPAWTFDRFSNLRQSELHDEGVDNYKVIASGWFYYDSKQEGNGAATDAFILRVLARDYWNTAVVDNVKTIYGSDLVDGAWNYLELKLDIPVQGLDPATPNYFDKFRRLIGVEILQNGWAGQTGDFYADDFAMTVIVPEPMTLTLLGLGGLFLRRRRA